MAVFGPYGIATTPDGQELFASLAGNYLGQIDVDTDGVTVLEPPMPYQGSRRILKQTAASDCGSVAGTAVTSVSANICRGTATSAIWKIT